MLNRTEILTNTVKIERIKRNLSQEELAKQVGVTRKTISSIENGKYVPSTLIAIKIAHELDCPVEDLFKIAKRYYM